MNCKFMFKAILGLIILPGFSMAQESAPAAVASSQFKNESEVAIVITTGNAQTQSASFKQKNTYIWNTLNSLIFQGRFLRAEVSSLESAKNWGLGLRYERAISDHLSAYLGQQVEGNAFAGFKQKYDSDLGGKYFFLKNEDWNSFAEVGYRYTIENRTSGNVKDHYLRAYFEVLRNWSKTFNTKLWLEFLPNLSESADRQINTEVSSSVALSEIFSVKLAYLLRYRSVLVGTATSKTDGTYTTSLVAKF